MSRMPTGETFFLMSHILKLVLERIKLIIITEIEVTHHVIKKL